MATYTKLPLSASVNGKNILLTAITSASANDIHTAVAGESDMDEIWLYVYNDATSSLSCSILWGGISEPADVTRAFVISQAGRTLLIDGKLLQNGLTVKAYAQVPNWLTIDGFVNRITVA
jgi:hypothetical protein